MSAAVDFISDIWFNLITWGVFGALSAVNLLVLLYRTERGAALRPKVLRFLRRISGREDLHWLDWRPLLVAATIAFVTVSAYGLLSGNYGCHPPGVSDPIGELSQGRAFLQGKNPFTVPDCGSTIEVPYGFAAVLIDAAGSLGGLPGIYVAWGVVALAIVPLVWLTGGNDRRYVLLYVTTSVLFVPLLSSQIDGATNTIVPTTIFLVLYLGARNEVLAAAIGGFLATARFPNLFPVLGVSGTYPRRRWLSFFAAAASFGAVTLLCFAVWRDGFLTPVFLSQIGRRSFSLNFYGVLLFQNLLPASTWIEGLQAALTVALVFYAFFRVRSPARSVSLVLVGFALLTPFLSFNILVWLLPVALAGARARWYLWFAAFVGSLNYDLGLNVWAWDDGISWPSQVMDVVFTAILLALFVELLRAEARDEPTDTPAPPAAVSASPAPPAA